MLAPVRLEERVPCRNLFIVSNYSTVSSDIKINKIKRIESFQRPNLIINHCCTCNFHVTFNIMTAISVQI